MIRMKKKWRRGGYCPSYGGSYVDVGGDAGGGAGHHHGCADDGNPTGINDFTRGGLRKCADAYQEEGRERQNE